ncbi:hypothetical protein FACS1894137_18750 [Spirochaetia bacterium]|nr:hypothetical protein FACS1894137_18750 [Spirochaetia bacterium]
MAFCSKCGTQVAEGVRFCTFYRTPIGGATAPVASAVKPAAFCGNCGQKLEGAAKL